MLELTEEELMIRDTARDFARNTLDKRGEEYDKSEEFPRQTFTELGELGFMGVFVPEEYGGAGLGTLEMALAMEELAWACPATSITIGVHNSLVTNAIKDYGNEEQKKKYLPGLATGEKLGAYCVTEPDVGSDVASIKATGVEKGGKYVINGTKSWISTGGVAEVLVVFVKTEDDDVPNSKRLSAFIVEPTFKGFSTGKEEKKMGLRASNTVQLIFEDMEVPAENLLGDRGDGMKMALELLNSGRIGVGAQSVGIAQRCLDESIAYSKERKQFGKCLCEFQAIQAKLANMATEIEAARLLVHKAARLKDMGKEHMRAASQAKLFASEACNRAADQAVQIHGGYGYIKEYAVERFFRDAKITEIYEGTNEIQRIVIARDLLG